MAIVIFDWILLPAINWFERLFWEFYYDNSYSVVFVSFVYSKNAAVNSYLSLRHNRCERNSRGDKSLKKNNFLITTLSIFNLLAKEFLPLSSSQDSLVAATSEFAQFCMAQLILKDLQLRNVTQASDNYSVALLENIATHLRLIPNVRNPLKLISLIIIASGSRCHWPCLSSPIPWVPIVSTIVPENSAQLMPFEEWSSS